MKYLITLILLCGLAFSTSAQEIFRFRWEGIGVQDFSAPQAIDSFTVDQSGGYVCLKAHAGADSFEIIRTKWQGTALQAFSPPQGEYITGFEDSVSGGWIYLTAVTNSRKGEILRTKWQGTAVQGYSAPSGEGICGLTDSVAGGWVYLKVSNTTHISEKPPRESPFFFGLDPISPNPCRRHAKISYYVGKPCQVTLQIYDSTGRLVKTPTNEVQNRGKYEYLWHGLDDCGRDAAAGVYFARLNAGDFSAVKKMIIIK